RLNEFRSFLASRQPIHLNHYRERYLKGAEAFDFEALQLEFSGGKGAVVQPATAHLNCEQIGRLAAALGEQDHYGIPFPFDAAGGWESCSTHGARFLELSSRLRTRTGLPNLRPLRSR